ncbi:MAG TPA: ATP-dependent metallopeptidase FtsH/Yme1/Tma family protein, partial [Nocardioidaceae bacterium]|nr:ATP-dependent metallopeptidase FtsH/Yme1/Tma family protein [Nocardioidaceae bacterium]
MATNRQTPADTDGPRRGFLDRLRGRPESDRPPPWRTEGAPRGEGDQQPPQPPRTGRFLWWVAAALAVNWIVMSLLVSPEPRTDVSYTFFVEQVDADNVRTVTATGSAIQGVFDRPVSYGSGEQTATDVTTFATERPAFAEDDLLETLEANGVEVNANPPDAPPPLWQRVLLGFGPTLLFVGLLLWFLRRSAAGLSGGLGSCGRSRATRYEPDRGPRTAFADVAGIDEVEHEVREIVD